MSDTHADEVPQNPEAPDRFRELREKRRVSTCKELAKAMNTNSSAGAERGLNLVWPMTTRGISEQGIPMGKVYRTTRPLYGRRSSASSSESIVGHNAIRSDIRKSLRPSHDTIVAAFTTKAETMKAKGIDIAYVLLSDEDFAKHYASSEDEVQKYRDLLRTTYQSVAGCDVVMFPIEDFSVPDSTIEYLETAMHIVDSIMSNRNVVIHCSAGIGRTGLMLAAVNMVLGPDYNGFWGESQKQTHYMTTAAKIAEERNLLSDAAIAALQRGMTFHPDGGYVDRSAADYGVGDGFSF